MATDYFNTTNFEVNIEGMESKQFTEIDGLEIRIEDTKYAEGAMHIQKSKKGRTIYQDLQLRRRFDGSTDMLEWLKACATGSLQKKSGSIILKDDDSKEALRFNFTGAWPSAWKGPQFSTQKKEANEVATEQVTLSVETLELG